MTTIINTGAQLGTAIISNGAVTGNQWSNANNLLLTDGDVSESNPGTVASDVVVGNFNAANVPSNAVITGIEIELIGAYSGAPTSPSITVTPYFLDNTSGSDVYYPYITPQVLSITPTDYVLGSPTYLFASSFTPNQINNAKIQLVANGDVYIDAVKINVFYYVPSTPTPPGPIGNVCIDCDSPIQAQPFYLALPFKAGDRYAYLQSFTYPDGTPIQYADLGSCGGTIKFVFDPGVSKVQGSNFEENAKTAVWTTQANGTVQLDFNSISANRGLEFHTPYTANPLLRSDHDANSKVIISDSAPFFGEYLQRCQIGALISAPIEVLEEGSSVATPVTKFNFKGPGQTAVQNMLDPEQVDITIPGAGGTTMPVTVATASISSGSVQVGTLTATLDISGLNRGAAIQISTEQVVTITSVTVGGVSATQEAVATDVAHNLRAEEWICVNPPLGPQSVVVTLSAPAYLTFGAECLNSIDTASPIGATQTASGTSNTPSLALTTTQDNSTVIDGLATGMTPILYTPGPGQGLNWSLVANADTRQGGSSVQAAGIAPDAITMQYAITQVTPWVYVAVEIKGITTPAVSGDHKVMVDGADTTPDYLDPKLNIHSSDGSVTVTKTITNPAANEIIDIDLTGAGGGGGSIPFTITQTNTFSVGDIITPDINQWKLSKADVPANAEAWAQVTASTGATFTALPLVGTRQQDAGILALIAGFAGGDVLYVDPVTAGAFTNVAPTTAGQVTKPIGYVEADGAGVPISLCTVNYRGQENLVPFTSSPSVPSQVLPYADGFGANATNIIFQTSTDGSVAFLGYFDANSDNITIFRLIRDPNTSQYGITHTTTFAVSSTNTGSIYGFAVTTNFVYLFCRDGATRQIERFNIGDLSSPTVITISGGSAFQAGAFSDGTDLYVHLVGSDYDKYTISGTTATYSSTITYTASNADTATCDGTNVFSTQYAFSGQFVMDKFPLAGGAATGHTTRYIFKDAFDNASPQPQLFIQNSGNLGMVYAYTPFNATTTTGCVLNITTITQP